jgi:hypothetical protein
MEMDNFTFGLSVTIVGMVGTIFVLWGISLIIDLLKKVFPYRESEEEKETN